VSAVATALISALTSVAVLLVSFLSSRAGRKKVLAETRFRLAEILTRNGQWFTTWGAYLASSAYLTACLFAWLKKTRDGAPYLRLGSEDDTRLSVLMLRVSHSFLRDHGIYHVLQPSIGQDMILNAEPFITPSERDSSCPASLKQKLVSSLFHKNALTGN
jgi:hypothetical protein